LSTPIEAGSRPARKCTHTSTKHHVVDEYFAALLVEDFGITTETILIALEGEPRRRSIAICAWAERNEDPAYARRCGAQRHSRGACRVPSVARGGGAEDIDGPVRASGPSRPHTVTPRRSYVLGPDANWTNVARTAD
jgi:hypothetical protein